MKKDDASFETLYGTVVHVDKAFAENTAKAINKNVTARNWLIGYYIVNYEQNGSDRAKYGEKIPQRLAEKLASRSLSYRNLKLYRQFYMEFPMLAHPIYNYVVSNISDSDSQIRQTVFAQLPSPNRAISDCPIGQPVVDQIAPELQLPPDKLFNELSYSNFLL